MQKVLEEGKNYFYARDLGLFYLGFIAETQEIRRVIQKRVERV